MSRKRVREVDFLKRRPNLFIGLLNKVQDKLEDSNRKRRRKWAHVRYEAPPTLVKPQTTVMQPTNKFGVRLVAPYSLYPYQIESVEWIRARETGVETNPSFNTAVRGCLFAMVMGLGKTIVISTVIAASLDEQRQARSCSLYICPKTLLGTVLFEINKFFGDQIKAKVYHRDFLKGGYNTFGDEDIRSCDVLITSYETILARYNSAEAHQSYGEVFMNFDWFRIILDESHWIRSKKTKLFRACMAMRSTRKICMTGTPIHNSLSDLFNQLQFSGLVLPRGVKCNKFTLRSLNLMQMVKFVEFKDVLDVRLPTMSVAIEYFALSAMERRLHDMFMTRARRAFRLCRGGNGVRGYTGMFRVMQVCSAPYLVTAEAKLERPSDEEGPREVKASEDEEPTIDVSSEPDIEEPSLPPVDIEAPSIRAFLSDRDGPAGTGSSKMCRFRELMTRVTEEDPRQKTVVFANFAATLRLLRDALGPLKARSVLVHGKITSSRAREQLLDTFRQSPNVTILLMTLKLGNVGLNLTEANRVIFFESWYSYAALAQGCSRVHRIGQVRPVSVHYILAKDSVEENMYYTAMAKKEMASDISQEKQSRLGVADLEQILFGHETRACMSDVSSEDEKMAI